VDLLIRLQFLNESWITLKDLWIKLKILTRCFFVMLEIIDKFYFFFNSWIKLHFSNDL